EAAGEIGILICVERWFRFVIKCTRTMEKCVQIGLLLLLGPVSAAAERPFPENRVRDFYLQQARTYLDRDKPLPEILPEFPGLDGGGWGYWGQNPEADNVDESLNEVDIGSVLAQVTKHFKKTTTKAVNVRLDAFSTLFDPTRLTFVDFWQGGFVRWQARRYGINSGVQPEGKQLDKIDTGWTIPDGIAQHYLGMYRHGAQAIFAYRIGPATVYDRVISVAGRPARRLFVEGELPPGVQLHGSLPAVFEDEETRRLTLGGPAQWKQQSVTLPGSPGRGKTPYLIDTLSVPYGRANPFKTPMRIGGFDILPDGRIAV
ncbi:MAG: DUF6797 domain-containing protein, partial [Verrucomicrobiota bacterium]